MIFDTENAFYSKIFTVSGMSVALNIKTHLTSVQAPKHCVTEICGLERWGFRDIG